ncbi:MULTISPECIES: hypothetical protein [unclassified Nocardiopsis]|uniref:hypothetical protein n=1 Tax=unclassified Nocardiopsis TaxID=2649073 RepID=UPI00135ABA32|nr:MULTISPECIES: hypothetical protein [unclassified Nocardiopsis]
MHPTPRQSKRNLATARKRMIGVGLLVALGLVGGLLAYLGVRPGDPPAAAPEQVSENSSSGPAPGIDDTDAYVSALADLDPGWVYPSEEDVTAHAVDLCTRLTGEGEEAALEYIEMVWTHVSHPDRVTTRSDAEALLDIVRDHACPHA